MACCLQVPDTTIFYFLQETAKLQETPKLAPNESPQQTLHTRTKEETQKVKPVSNAQHIKNAANLRDNYASQCISTDCTGELNGLYPPGTCSIIPTLSNYNSMEVLNLISAQCHDLVGPEKAPQNDFPVLASKQAKETEFPVAAEEAVGHESPCFTGKVRLVGNLCENRSVSGNAAQSNTKTEKWVRPEQRFKEHFKESCMKTKGTGAIKFGVKALATGHKTKATRKQLKPTRSAEKWDPMFKGVTIHMKTQLTGDCNDQCRLLITSHYSSVAWKKNPRSRVRPSQNHLLAEARGTGTSDEESGWPCAAPDLDNHTLKDTYPAQVKIGSVGLMPTPDISVAKAECGRSITDI
nr:PREDICTED: uncharacterized protein LOC102347039 [Latimeria chalumnae]|eukprot:XP_014351954.1 PREDICTED: uncharacterized protein LOC102347039 [Latimeria chalumnae]